MKRVAVLIDGAFYIKRLSYLHLDINVADPVAVASIVPQLVRAHLEHLNKTEKQRVVASDTQNPKYFVEPNWYVQHYRTFFYDAPPFKGRTTHPVSKEEIILGKHERTKFQLDLFAELKKQPYLALRLGECRMGEWGLRPNVVKKLRNNELSISELEASHFRPGLRQKGVDLRLGLDMASIAIKKHADIFVLITGDADFVPAAKMVRREGCHVILNPLWNNIAEDLSEHIDDIHNIFPKP